MVVVAGLVGEKEEIHDARLHRNQPAHVLVQLLEVVFAVRDAHALALRPELRPRPVDVDAEGSAVRLVKIERRRRWRDVVNERRGWGLVARGHGHDLHRGQRLQGPRGGHDSRRIGLGAADEQGSRQIGRHRAGVGQGARFQTGDVLLGGGLRSGKAQTVLADHPLQRLVGGVRRNHHVARCVGSRHQRVAELHQQLVLLAGRLG